MIVSGKWTRLPYKFCFKYIRVTLTLMTKDLPFLHTSKTIYYIPLTRLNKSEIYLLFQEENYITQHRSTIIKGTIQCCILHSTILYSLRNAVLYNSATSIISISGLALLFCSSIVVYSADLTKLQVCFAPFEEVFTNNRVNYH